MDQLRNKKSHKVDFKDNKAKIREELISDRDENLSNQTEKGSPIGLQVEQIAYFEKDFGGTLR